MLTSEGYWICEGINGSHLTPKQWEIINDTHRYLLVSGPRETGKSLAVMHRLARHLWETPNAILAIFNWSIPGAISGGIWSEFIKTVMTQWTQSGIGMQYTTKNSDKQPGPKIDVRSKGTMFKVTNMHGGESECYLFSLNNMNEVEQRLKSKTFSGIYFPELSNFKSEDVLVKSQPQLRLTGLPYEYHMWIADTNPDEDGEQSWIFKTWYVERLNPENTERHNFGLIEVNWDDAPFLTDQKRRDYLSMCRNDKALYDRWTKGLWASGGLKERHFANYFSEDVHVQGDFSSPNKADWQYVMPTDDCTELWTSWDPGDVNNAIVFGETILTPDGLCACSILDEIVEVGVKMSCEELTLKVMEKMDMFEDYIRSKAGRHARVSWNHWADEAMVNNYRATVGSNEAALIDKISRGRIVLQGCPKGVDSVIYRVQMVKQLLGRNRLMFGRNCVKTIEAIKELRKGKNKSDYVQRSGNPHKHPFDALTYGLHMETWQHYAYDVKTATRSELVQVR